MDQSLQKYLLPKSFIYSFYSDKNIKIFEDQFQDIQILESISNCEFGGEIHSYCKSVYCDNYTRGSIFHVIRKYKNSETLNKCFNELIETQSEKWLALPNQMNLENNKV